MHAGHFWADQVDTIGREPQLIKNQEPVIRPATNFNDTLDLDCECVNSFIDALAEWYVVIELGRLPFASPNNWI